MKGSPNEILAELLGTANFAALTPENQQKVLQEMTSEEYDLYHSLVEKSKAALQPPYSLPSSTLGEIKANLATGLSPDLSLSQKIYKASMPIWLAAGLALLSYGFVQLLQGNSIAAQQSITTNHIIITDTIYVETTDTLYIKIPSKPKTIIKEIIKTVEVERTTPMAVFEKTEKSSQLIPKSQSAYYSNVETAELLAGRPGKSVEEEDELMELLDLNEK